MSRGSGKLAWHKSSVQSQLATFDVFRSPKRPPQRSETQQVFLGGKRGGKAVSRHHEGCWSPVHEWGHWNTTRLKHRKSPGHESQCCIARLLRSSYQGRGPQVAEKAQQTECVLCKVEALVQFLVPHGPLSTTTGTILSRAGQGSMNLNI